MFWACPKLSHFWSSIFGVFSKVLSVDVRLCPLLAIFGVPPDPLPINATEADMLTFATLLARRCILLTWKQSAPPPFSGWLKDMIQFSKIGKYQIHTQGRQSEVLQKMAPFHCLFHWFISPFT